MSNDDKKANSKAVRISQVFELAVGIDFCNRAIHVGDEYSGNCWQIGRMTADALSRLADAKLMIIRGEKESWASDYILSLGTMDIYPQMALRFGIKTRTVRDYYSVVNYYSDEQAEKYEVLPFSHYRFAKKCGDDLAIKVLDLSLRAMDSNGGKPPSVDWLEVNLWRVTGDESIVDDLNTIADFQDATSNLSDADFDDDEPMPATVFFFLGSLQTLLGNLQKRLDKLHLKSSRKEKIDQIIVMVGRITDELHQDILEKQNE